MERFGFSVKISLSFSLPFNLIRPGRGFHLDLDIEFCTRKMLKQPTLARPFISGARSLTHHPVNKTEITSKRLLFIYLLKNQQPTPYLPITAEVIVCQMMVKYSFRFLLLIYEKFNSIFFGIISLTYISSGLAAAPSISFSFLYAIEA